MRNITVSIDEETHRFARIRAAELDTSVSALVREYLKSLRSSNVGGAAPVSQETDSLTKRRVEELERVFTACDERGVGVRITDRLSRDELYDEAMASRRNAVR